MTKANAKLSPQQALIYAMVTMSAVDRSMSDEELARIGSIVQDLPVFRDFDPNQLTAEAQACGAALSEAEGLEGVLSAIAAALPSNLRETAYMLAAEVAATDLKVRQEEIRLLQLLANRLGLDKLTIAALERGARARHQVA